jgi:cystathionine beta-lyase/cystathionine gamma-synthase
MENGLTVAKYLKGHPKVLKVCHPLFEDDPGYAIMKK